MGLKIYLMIIITIICMAAQLWVAPNIKYT